jgi:hypothetical protein
MLKVVHFLHTTPGKNGMYNSTNLHPLALSFGKSNSTYRSNSSNFISEKHELFEISNCFFLGTLTSDLLLN